MRKSGSGRPDRLDATHRQALGPMPQARIGGALAAVGRGEGSAAKLITAAPTRERKSVPHAGDELARQGQLATGATHLRLPGEGL